ncbi:hypothetical protein GE454_18790 [Pseudomonas soli]|nr:hypothetical protein [Pseudomonas soli]
MQAGRDIDVKGRDINIDVAHGSSTQKTRESQNWAGIHGGTSGGIKVGIGASHGAAGADGTQGNSTPSQLDAGRDIKLDASHDLNIVGSQVKAGRDIDLAAGNDLNIRAAQNDSHYEQNRRSGGGEVGLAFGSEGVGIYASVNLGKGKLERDAQRHQEAYVYAGDQLKFSSGKDTNIKGAQVRGDEVIGRVGGDLNVASAIDTGKVKGKEFDLSATVTVGPGSGISGSVGKGKTTGETEWVENQTRITARDKVDIRTENHTQLDGALIASDNGNLKLDTGTLGHSDIAGKDQERGYYLNVGGTWKKGTAATQQDSSQTGKGDKGENGWSVSGWKYEKDREQIVRATVGAGDITVRKDAETGKDSTVGLNRDLDKAYEITRDKESRTDLYVTDSSLHDALNPKETLAKWQVDLSNYGVSSFTTASQLFDMVVSMTALATGESPRAVVDRLASNEEDRQNALAFAKSLTRLDSFDSATREAGIAALMTKVTGGHESPEAEQVKLLVNRLSADSPEAAQMVMLKLLGLSRGNPLRQNFNAGAVATAEVLVALAAASSVYLAAPNSQEGWEKANASFMTAMGELREKSTEDFEQAVDIWLWLHGKGRGGFPINPFDTKTVYENPVVRDGKHPVSDGYNGNGQHEIITHTGGQQLDGVGGVGGYVTPIDQLNPGIMLSIFGDKEISKATIRTTSNQTRLGDKGGEPGVHIEFADGTSFDMTRTRVKETEPNPYVPGKTRPVRYDDALDNSGKKRAPTEKELNWFLEYVQNKSG